MSLLDEQPLKWEEWKEQLVKEFVAAAGFPESEVRRMLEAQGDDGWRVYWEDAYSPAAAVSEDMSCWDDGSE